MIYMLLQSILHRVYFWNKLSQAVTTGDTGAQYSETAHDITLAALRMVAVYDWLLSPTMPPQDWWTATSYTHSTVVNIHQ